MMTNYCSKYLVIFTLVFLFISVVYCKDDKELKPGEPANVTYDGRSLMINGKREIFFSGAVHYPRVPEKMWGDILDKCKEGGLNMVETYTFWNLHEPEKGKYNFTGNYDLVKFIKMIAERGMWATIRIGPFLEGEWTNGGFPFWLRMQKNIMYRTNNEPFKKHMGAWVTKLVSVLKENNLYAPQGGPIVLSQIENEYDNIKRAYGIDGVRYVHWAAKLGLGQKTGVPWFMCKAKDAPGEVINACNGRNCGDTFTGPNSPNKPYLWTEDWTAQYRAFGDPPSQRATEDIAFSETRWFSKNGSLVNYYMYFGGTNYERSASSFVTTRYYDEAPIDEFGLLRGPKWGHLKDLHYALQLSKKALLEGNYNVQKFRPDLEARVYEKGELCVAFLWNNATNGRTQTANFRGREYIIPSKSISILPDCNNVVFNTKQIVAQHNSRNFVVVEEINKNLKWEKIQEKIPTKTTFFRAMPKDQYDSTRDATDYMWYSTSIELDNLDLPFKESALPVLQVISLGHSLVAYVNGEFVGTGHGSKLEPTFIFKKEIKLTQGVNNISILSNTVGMPASGAHMEKRWAGIAAVQVQGLTTGKLDLTYNGWRHKISLLGETDKYFTEEGAQKVDWIPANAPAQPLTWYKTYFDAPKGDEPLAIEMTNMTKGLIYVNGHNLGRHWSSFITERGGPSQEQYHLPRAFVKEKKNLLVIFDEEGGNIDTVKIARVNRDTICSSVSESMVGSVMSWKTDEEGKLKEVDDHKPKVMLKCPKDKVIIRVDFAHFGNPDGICGFFVPRCTASDSQQVVEQFCLGKEECTVPVDRNLFDKNACPEVPIKTLSVQVQCGPRESKA